jgi:chitin disaccharide deacetylase
MPFCHDAKFLIIHADDFGMCHSVNAAIIDAIHRGVVTSTSIMTPCPWVGEAAEFVRAHPAIDVGIHLTVTSEWKNYRWRPLTQMSYGSGITDRFGYFSAGNRSVPASCELEAELLAQIEFAKQLGVNPTHLDSHMFALFGPEARRQLYMRVAHAVSLPFLLMPRLRLLTSDSAQAPVDHLIFMDGRDPIDSSWTDWYDAVLRSLQPGLTELIVHPGWDEDELRSITGDMPDCGASWRQKDYEVLTSTRFRQGIQENDIELTTWGKVSTMLGQHEQVS